MAARIPFVDLASQYKRIKPGIDAAIAEVLERTQFVGGTMLAGFEEAFAQFCGVDHAVGTGSGTASLHLALAALGIGKGDEVILPSHTFIATVEPVLHVGARPVFADIDPHTFTLDPASVERCLSDRTKAIIPVHLYGQMVDMLALREVLSRIGRQIAIIEDAAQAHGAMQCGRSAGGVGTVACFSFYPGKNLGAYGDAGAVTTSDPQLAERIRKLRDHGREDKYRHDMIGFNYRLDTMQAAILNTKLTHLPEWNARRRSRAELYDQGLTDVSGVTIPQVADGNEPVYHLYVIQVDRRDELREYLSDKGIASGIHYPIPLHRQPAMAPVDHAADSLAVTESVVDRILSLPMYPELADDQVERVVEAVRTFQLEVAPSLEKQPAVVRS